MNLDIDSISNDYRMEAFRLMQSIDQDVARSLGRSLLASPSFHNYAPKELSSENGWAFDGPICRACGDMLSSGVNGCKVRVKSLKISRTMRRRVSRYKKASLLKEARLKQKGGQSRKSLNKVIGKRPISCANILMYKCGHCGREETFAGCDTKSKQRNKLNDMNKISRSNSPKPLAGGRDSFSFVGGNKPLIEKGTSPKSQSDMSSSDFIALPKGTPKSSLLSQTRKRKKKNSTQDTKKSKLMSFLSSLND